MADKAALSGFSLPADATAAAGSVRKGQMDAMRRPTFQGRATAVQVLSAANTYYPVTLQAEDLDDENWHDTTTNPSRCTVARAGRYRVSGNPVWDSNTASAGRRGARLTRNGTLIPGSQSLGNYVASTNLTTPIPPLFVVCAVNDYLELSVFSSVAGVQLIGSAADGSMLVVEYAGAP